MISRIRSDDAFTSRLSLIDTIFGRFLRFPSERAVGLSSCPKPLRVFGQIFRAVVEVTIDKTSLWGQDKAYSDLMRELWGSPSRWNVRKSSAEVASKLGVDEETVRNRLKRLKESGFLLGWKLVPNPALLGRKSAFLLLEFEDPGLKEQAISRLRQMDGVASIANIYGKSLLITLFDDDEDHVSSNRISEMGIRGEVLIVPGMGFPPTTFRMTVTDWQIARLMLRNAEKKITEIATEVKVSTRTVKRRLNQMMDASAIFIMPMIDQRNSGGVSYQLMVESNEGKRSEVERLVAAKIGNLVFSAADSRNGSIFGFTGRNVAEGNEILRWVKEQPGVKSARMNIVEEVVYVFDWVERELETLSSTR
jgi:DNA-binding Lrp family transcriptional regulator